MPGVGVFLPRSMTGYGSEESEYAGYRIQVEIRSVNHRGLDIQVRMPRELWPLECNIREVVQSYIFRGRIDIYIALVKVPDDAVRINVDHALARAYYNALRELEESIPLLPQKICSLELARFPEVLVQNREALDLENAWQSLQSALKGALAQLVDFREKEGQRLAEDLLPRLKNIASLVQRVEERNSIIVDSYREKLVTRLHHLLPEGGLDEQRLYQELALFAERSDISEEIVRLKSHLSSFFEVMERKGVVGRRMDFILQEMLREVNTIAAKGNDVETAKIVVEMKSELEKIREQIQNLE